MRILSSRWSLSAAGLISAAALAACSSTPAPAPAPAPVVAPAPAVMPPMVKKKVRRSKAWYRKHRRAMRRKKAKRAK